MGSLQWVVRWYGMGKTSTPSRLNLPGRMAWLTMEAPGFLTLLYVMRTLPARHGIDDLPWQNRVLAGLFVCITIPSFRLPPPSLGAPPRPGTDDATAPKVIHYTYRALLFPLLQPSMAPIHVAVWVMAIGFQLLNATCLGAWLAAYGPVTAEAWAAQSPLPQFVLGLAVFYAGLAANMFHDEELREIRRRKQSGGGGHYEIPQAGLFRYVLYPHYLCEWVEWAGFLVAAGWSCAPAWAFLANEVCAMLPRAVRGKAWYVERFGADKVGRRWAVVPGVW